MASMQLVRLNSLRSGTRTDADDPVSAGPSAAAEPRLRRRASRSGAGSLHHARLGGEGVGQLLECKMTKVLR